MIHTRQISKLIAAVCAIVITITVVSRVQAATITVCASGCDYTSIQSAIDNPLTVNGDIIELSGETYTEINIDVHKSVTIRGVNAASTIVQSNASVTDAFARVFTIDNNKTVTLENMTIRHGNTNGAGGGIFNNGTLTVNNSTISNNISNGHGGGIHNNNSLTINNTTISDNQSRNGNGAGIRNNAIGDTLSINNSIVANNSATKNGGGISNNAGTTTITNSLIINNSTTVGAAGVNTSGTSGNLIITNSTISGNTAGTNGGGILQGTGNTTITFSTITNNRAANSGANNGNGGGIVNNNGTFTISNSIVSGNVDGTVAGIVRHDCNGTITSNGYNVFGRDQNSQNCPTGGTGDIIPTGAANTVINTSLANNGGSTQTHALVDGGPASDLVPNGTNGCGTTVTTDQRGESRPSNTNCDAGAYESTTYADATATANANATATAIADLTATAIANVTATAEANATATAIADLTATAIANLTATAEANAAATANALINASPDGNPNTPVENATERTLTDPATGAWFANGLSGYVFNVNFGNTADGSNSITGVALQVVVNGYEYCLVGEGYTVTGFVINQDASRSGSGNCFTYNPTTDWDIYRIDFAVEPITTTEADAPANPSAPSSDTGTSNTGSAEILNTPAPTADWALYYAQQTATAAANAPIAESATAQPTAEAIAQPEQQQPVVVAIVEPTSITSEAEPVAAIATTSEVPTAIPTDVAVVMADVQPTYTAMNIQVPLAEVEPAIDVAPNSAVGTGQWVLLSTFVAGSVMAFGLLGGMALRSLLNKEER